MQEKAGEIKKSKTSGKMCLYSRIPSSQQGPEMTKARSLSRGMLRSVTSEENPGTGLWHCGSRKGRSFRRKSWCRRGAKPLSRPPPDPYSFYLTKKESPHKCPEPSALRLEPLIDIWGLWHLHPWSSSHRTRHDAPHVLSFRSQSNSLDVTVCSSRCMRRIRLSYRLLRRSVAPFLEWI